MPALDQRELIDQVQSETSRKGFPSLGARKASASAARASLRVVVTLRIHEMKGPIVRARHGCARASATGEARARPGEPTASSIIAARKRVWRGTKLQARWRDCCRSIVATQYVLAAQQRNDAMSQKRSSYISAAKPGWRRGCGSIPGTLSLNLG